MELGERIYKLRTERNLSQGDLADRLQVSRQSVSKWENNTAVPDLDKLIKMCDIFEISLDEITGREKPKDKPLNKIEEIKSSLTKTQFIGCILFGVGLILALIFPILSPSLIICGVICLTVRKKPWYWCIWAAYLPIQITLDWILISTMIPPIIELVFFIVITVVTYKHIKDVQFKLKKENRKPLFVLSIIYAIAYAIGVVIVCQPWEPLTGMLRWSIGIIYAPINLILTMILGFTMIYVVSYIREARQKKYNNDNI